MTEPNDATGQGSGREDLPSPPFPIGERPVEPVEPVEPGLQIPVPVAGPDPIASEDE